MLKMNKFMGIGRLTKDPVLTYLPSGTAVARFTIAMNDEYKDKEGISHKTVDYVEVNMLGKRGEVICEYFTKGMPIYVEGRLQFSQWETDSGSRTMHRIIASNFQFVQNKKREEAPIDMDRMIA